MKPTRPRNRLAGHDRLEPGSSLRPFAVAGVLAFPLLAAPSVVFAVDTDGDGISDTCETSGCNGATGTFINFPALGAHADRKDIFIELDVMSGHSVIGSTLDTAVADIQAAFVQGPVLNPDGSIGIDVHFDTTGRVTSNTCLIFGADDGGDRGYPRVEVNANGRAIMVWHDDRNRDSVHEIYARGFNSSGGNQFCEVHVDDISVGDQWYPDVAVNDSGNFVVVWQDDADDNGYYNIRAKMFTSTGNDSFDSILVNSTTAGQQTHPSVGIDANGNFTVVWQDDRNETSNWEIYGRRFDSTGAALTSEFLVAGTTDGIRYDPEIAMAPDGRGVVAWEDDRNNNGYYEIYGRRLSSSTGLTTGSEIHVNSTSAGQQVDAAVAIVSDGTFVVAWRDDQDENGYYEIYSRRFNSSGTATTGEISVNAVSDGQQLYPSVGIDDSGVFTVAWQDDQDENGYYDIMARSFSSSGSALTSGITVNTTTSYQQLLPAVGMDRSTGDASIAFQDDSDNDGDTGVMFRIIDTSGTGVTASISSTTDTSYFQNVKSSSFTANRAGYYHYAIIGNSSEPGTGGTGEIGGDDFMITKGTSPVTRTLEGATMHELGHNLGLSHGGDENTNGKPNYKSMMTYAFSPDGVIECQASSSPSNLGVLDFSRGRKFDLDENDLDERIGTCNGEKDVNWLDDFNQYDPDIDANDAGEFTVAWADDRDDDGEYDVYARFYDDQGDPVEVDVLVNDVNTANQERDPAVGIDGSGESVVVWEDDRDGDGNYDIYAQRFDANANEVSSEFRVNATSTDDQRNPDIAVAADGTIVVVWEDDRDGDGTYLVYARKFSSSNSALTGDTAVASSSSASQFLPRVEIATDTRFVVTWSDLRNGDYDVYARRFSSSGTAAAADFRVNSTTSNTQFFSDIAVQSDGKFVVTWMGDSDGDYNFQIEARRYTATGTAYAAFTVNQTASANQYYPRIAATGTGGFAVVWEDDESADDIFDIYLRTYDASGTARMNEDQINPTGTMQQLLPAVGADSSDNVYLVWEDDRDNNNYWEIWAARTDSIGSLRDKTSIDFDGSGTIGSSVVFDVNDDDSYTTLHDYNDWSNLDLDF